MYCSVSYLLTGCVPGRFGVNCDRICHCNNDTKDCQIMDGQCKTGCAQYYTGVYCQGNVLGTLTAWCVHNGTHLV